MNSWNVNAPGVYVNFRLQLFATTPSDTTDELHSMVSLKIGSSIFSIKHGSVSEKESKNCEHGDN